MQQIVRTWRLLAASAHSGSERNDTPYGPTSSGHITYTADGRVMAIISHSGRKPLASGDRISATVVQDGILAEPRSLELRATWRR